MLSHFLRRSIRSYTIWGKYGDSAPNRRPPLARSSGQLHPPRPSPISSSNGLGFLGRRWAPGVSRGPFCFLGEDFQAVRSHLSSAAARKSRARSQPNRPRPEKPPRPQTLPLTSYSLPTAPRSCRVERSTPRKRGINARAGRQRGDRPFRFEALGLYPHLFPPLTP